MPNVVDIVELAQDFEAKPIMARAEKCSKVRNRNSGCSACIDACPVDGTITIERNEFKLDYELCCGCGACTTVCPTEAIVPCNPLDSELAEQLAQSCLAVSDGYAVIACARMAAKGIGDPRKYAEVACLCRVEESVIVDLAAHGIEHILLVDADCSTCRFRHTVETTEAVCVEATKLFSAWGIPADIRRSSELPANRLLHDSRGLLGESRRSFFTRGRDSAKDVATKTALKKLNLEDKPPSLRQMLSVGTGKMPQFTAVRRTNLLDDLDAFGAPVSPTIDTRLWGTVRIDADVCNGCAMCTVFCPTGALRKGPDYNNSPSTETQLEFSACDCVQCGLCVDACFKKCLEVMPTVDTAELVSIEPRVITIPPKTGTKTTDFSFSS